MNWHRTCEKVKNFEVGVVRQWGIRLLIFFCPHNLQGILREEEYIKSWRGRGTDRGNYENSEKGVALRYVVGYGTDRRSYYTLQ